MNTEQDIVIQTRNLKKYFPLRTGFYKKKFLRAIDNVNLSIYRGEILGLVGESGCGKSTLARTIFHLYPPTEGEVLFQGIKITSKNRVQFTKKMQLVFQNSYGALDPRIPAGEAIGEALDVHGQCLSLSARCSSILEYMEKVGLDAMYASYYPHEMSGGQRQRIGIARALAVGPEFIAFDEPVSALDVSIQSQIINLLMDLQEEYNLTYLFITHDLLVAHHIANRICVMYLGKIVELAACDELFHNPVHPYTQALLSAAPIPFPQKSGNNHRIEFSGSTLSPVDFTRGCSYYERCQYAEECCKESVPILKEVAPGHFAACHLV